MIIAQFQAGCPCFFLFPFLQLLPLLFSSHFSQPFLPPFHLYSFLLVLTLFLQIRALTVIIVGTYQVLTVYQALGSAFYIHHLMCASQQPYEVGIVIILTLQTSNWSQGKLVIPKGTQLGNIGDPILTDITSAALFPLLPIRAKRRVRGETEMYCWKVLNIDVAEGWALWKVLRCHMIL